MKIAIFSDHYNGPLICAAAYKLGLEPYLFFHKHYDEDLGINYYCADPEDPLPVFSRMIESALGGPPDAVICCIEQFCVRVAEYANMINIAINPFTAYDLLRNKKRMKENWLLKGVTTAKSIYCEKINDIPFAELEYPLIIKPTLGAASAGVKICHTEADLRKQANSILRFNITTFKSNNRKSGFLIEEYIEGEEYSVDTIWYNGEPYLDAIMEKGQPTGPSFPDRLYVVSDNIQSSIRKELLNSSHAAVIAAGVNAGATHTEIRVKNGKGYIIESALRPGAGGCFYGLFEECFGVSFYEALILSSLPNLSEEQLCYLNCLKSSLDIQPRRIKYWYNIGYEGSGIIKSIDGVDYIQNLQHVDRIKIHKKIGEFLPLECDSFVYFGWIMGTLKHDSFDQYYQLLLQTEKFLKVSFKGRDS